MSFKQILSIPGVFPVLFTLFMASFGFGVILPILPFYALSLGAQPFELGMLTATFAFMGLIFSPLFGKLSDRIGRKKVLMIGALGFVTAYLVFAFTSSLEMAFAARAIEGIFAAGIFPACISLLSDLTSREQRGKAMGFVGMSFSLGFIVGPAFGGVVSAISIKDVFFLSALLAFINFISIYLQIKEPKKAEESSDFVRKEIGILERISSPMLFVFLSTFMITFMIGGLDATLAIYTGDKLGFSSPQIGIVFTYIGILIMLMQGFAGNLINRFGELRMIQIGLLLSGIGFSLLVFTHDWPSLMLALGVFVAGNASVFPSVSSTLTKSVSGKRGAILGLDASFRSLGQLIGPLLGGFLYGINHDYAFMGLALVTFAYFLFFSFFARKRIAKMILGTA